MKDFTEIANERLLIAKNLLDDRLSLFLKNKDIKILILDQDNTLRAKHETDIHPFAIRWIEKDETMFLWRSQLVRVFIVSNLIWPKRSRLLRLENTAGAFMHYSRFSPDYYGLYFHNQKPSKKAFEPVLRFARENKISYSQICSIGDQWTDVKPILKVGGCGVLLTELYGEDASIWTTVFMKRLRAQAELRKLGFTIEWTVKKYPLP